MYSLRYSSTDGLKHEIQRWEIMKLTTADACKSSCVQVFRMLWCAVVGDATEMVRVYRSLIYANPVNLRISEIE